MNDNYKYKNIFDKLNIVIDDFELFSKYVDIFSLKRIIIDYGHPFIDQEKNIFYPFLKSSEIISFINFDKELSLSLLKSILMLENKLKNIIITQWIEFYNLENTKIYNFKDELLIRLWPNIESQNCKDLNFAKFKYSLFEYTVNSEFLYEYTTLVDIPIEDLSKSWSFATVINFYRVLDGELQKKILKKFNLDDYFYDVFHKMLNVFLKVRNMLSHNTVTYNLSVELYKFEFNKIYKSIINDHISDNSKIYFDNLVLLIDYLTGIKLCENSVRENLKKLLISQMFKEKIIKIIYNPN